MSCAGKSVGSGSATACSCLSHFRVNYELCDAINSKVLVENKLTGRSTLPIFECNALCKCSDACRNREVQHGVKRELQIFRTGSRGLGVKTLSGLHRGEFVCEYAGEVLTESEASSRAAQQKATDMNYVISVREHLGSGITATYVDPRTYGNVGRFINHSCDPNLIMLPVRVDSDIPRLALFAARPITIDEELTFHYGGESPEDYREGGIPCRCGSARCEGFLPFDPTVLPC